MVEYNPSNEPEANKRQSTRIVQAIPLVVSGVDALGQPFRERTSTMCVNCHGFKCLSKHYVLKGTFLEIEVPDPEAGKAPRKVRGHVTFVQRPRTVKELFQVGVEFETPGNVWGIAFPPEDWSSFTETGEYVELELPEAPTVVPPAPSSKAATTPLGPVPVSTTKPTEVPPPPPPLPVSPAAAAEAAASVNRQITRMLADAQEQIQRAAKEASAAAVSREADALLRELNVQTRAAAEKAVEQAASTYADQAMQKVLRAIEDARTVSTQELRATWKREFEKDLREKSEQLLSKLADEGKNVHTQFSQQVSSDLAAAAGQFAELEKRIKDLQEELNLRTSHLPDAMKQARREFDAFAEGVKKEWSERLNSHADKGLSRMARLEEAARKLQEQIQAAADSAQVNWQKKLEQGVAEADARMIQALEATLNNMERQVTLRVSEVTASAASQATAGLAQRAEEIQAKAASAIEEAEKRVGSVRASLDAQLLQGQACSAQLAAVTGRVQEQSQHLEELARNAGAEVVKQFENLLATHHTQLDEQVDAYVVGLLQRLEASLNEQGMGMVERVSEKVEKEVQKRLHRPDGALSKFAALETAALESMRKERERLQADFEKDSQKVLERCAEELEAKSTDATHNTFEQLYKSAEWYQHKAQASMQTAFDKGVNQATTHLREKAAEISTLFASELDHYSRSYSEHTQGLLDEAAKEMASRIRADMSLATEAGTAKFSDEIHSLAENKIERMQSMSGSVVEETQARLMVQVESTCRQLDSLAAQSVAEFQQRFTERLQQGVQEAKDEFQVKIAPVLEDWRAEARASQEQWLKSIKLQGSEAADQFKQRLENISNSWMVAAVTTLTQHSQGVLDSLAKSVEQRLRDTCAEVFVGVGDSLRQRLLGISDDLKRSKS